MPPTQSASAPWRSRPVFISSTFRDMHAERDHLVNKVFPELAERLRPLRVNLEPIDLRVGVETAGTPEEEKKHLLVLKVVLDDIVRSRPFLVVLVGDRYGWVPPRERMDAAAQEKGFATDTKGKSVTALEIEFGVLDSPDQRKRSFFYFRNPLPYEDMDSATAAIYSDAFGPEHAEAVARLEALKERIRKDLPERVRTYDVGWDTARKTVTGLDDFGRMVLEDLRREIEAEAREAGLQPAPTELEEFIEHRGRDFTGREDILHDVMHLVRSPARQGADWGLCITGEPGSGKSALFAHLAGQLAKEDLLLLTHAAGISPEASRVDAMLRGWIAELADKTGVPDPLAGEETSADAGPRTAGLPGEGPSKRSSAEEVEKAFAELLSMAAVQRRVVLLPDALNQFEPTPRARHLTWLPELWPPNARLIATAVPGTQSKALAARRGVSVKVLRPLTQEEAQHIAEAVYARYHRKPNPDVLRTLMAKTRPNGLPATGNPLWLELALEELNLLDADDFARADREYVGTPEERLVRMVLDVADRLPPDVEGLYAWMLERTEELYGRSWASAFANLTALSRGGWRDTDLQQLLPKVSGKDWDPLAFAALRRAFRAHLVRHGAAEQWDFFHVQMREAIRRRNLVDPAQITRLHSLIADHLLDQPRDDSLRQTESMFHLIGADDRRRAVSYFGSYLTDEEKKAASGALAEHILSGEEDPENGNLAWVCSLLDQQAIPDETIRGAGNRFNFDLLAVLADEANVATRITLLQSARMTFHRLRKRAPDSAEYARDLSVSFERLGDLYVSLGNPPRALEHYQKALEISEELRKRAPDSAEYARDLVVSYYNLATFCEQGGSNEQAADYWVRCRDVLRRMKATGMYMDQPILQLLEQLEEMA